MLESKSHYLATGRHLLQLSRVAGQRIPTWDTLLLTASSGLQAELYRQQVENLVTTGRIPSTISILIVEDPAGVRIGSGGATLAALRQAAHAGIDLTGRTLLIHAGGDSKRLPWASVPGKIFVPFPLHGHPDHPVPTLAEQLLASVAAIPGQIDGPCLLVASGDVLPLFPAVEIQAQPDSITLIVTTAPLAVAGRHGVAVLDAQDRVTDLLQKASPETLAQAGAVLADGSAWIDTGLVAIRGRALQQFITLASAPIDPVATLETTRQEISLYEELLSAAVPERHDWLRKRPLGEELIAAGRGLRLHAWRCPDFGFVHLGTNTEYIAHCQHPWAGRMTRRLLAEHGPLVASDASILVSRLDGSVHVGRGSVVILSELGGRTRVGNRCVVYQVSSDDLPLDIPDNTCIWQVALQEGGWATFCCGTDDNPKDRGSQAKFLGVPMTTWMAGHGIRAAELWEDGHVGDLWSARLFPIGEAGTALPILRWILADHGLGDDADQHLLELWRRLPRTSMARSAATFDPSTNLLRSEAIQRELAVRILAGAVETYADLAIGPIASTLAPADRPLLLDLAERVRVDGHSHVARSRRLRLRADLQLSAGNLAVAERYALASWEAVSLEVSQAQATITQDIISDIPPGALGTAELHARFDLAGGWSDTPPYCLERPARVLNMAIELDGQRPIGARAEAIAEPYWELQIDDLEPVRVTADQTLPVAGLQDPYALPKVACAIMGLGNPAGITQGLRLRAWSRVPKGSGLGGSSILAAAICTAVARMTSSDASPEAICARVLAVEQVLTTRGGWQDQLGGLLPGIKLLSSLPVRPMAIHHETVVLAPGVADEFHARLVIAYTGISRLARDVLQRVVSGYLSRDALVVGGIQRLAECAEQGRNLLSNGDFDGLGTLFREVWSLHQDLDPNCSNPAVDRMLATVADWTSGWKLAGAGGGGFVGILAKDPASANHIKARLAQHHGVRVYQWRIGQDR